MPKTLHILNGISSFNIFNRSGIEGEAIAWNEILCEGPTLSKISSRKSHQIRQSFTDREFSGHGYDEIVLGIWDLLDSSEAFDEIVCWYEYDLFCQINFMAMIHWMTENRSDEKVSIICAGLDDSGRLKGLGQYAPDNYLEFYQSRQLLSSAQRELASKVWNTYCSSSHDQLLTLTQKKNLPYLNAAMEAHLRRFPWITDHLSEHQRQILSWVVDGAKSNKELVGKCLRNNGYYGFGDLQYFNMINDLTPCIDWEKGQLTEYGDVLIEGNGDTSKLPVQVYGGASTEDFRYDPIKKQLIAWPQ